MPRIAASSPAISPSGAQPKLSGQPHDPALDQARQPEPLRSDEPGGAQRRQAQPRAHVSRHPAVTDQEHEQAQPEQGEADLRHHLYREVPDRAGHGRS